MVKLLGYSQHQIYVGLPGKVVRVAIDPDVVKQMIYIQALLKRFEIPHLALQDDADFLSIATEYGVSVQDILPPKAKSFQDITIKRPWKRQEKILAQVEKEFIGRRSIDLYLQRWGLGKKSVF